MPISGFVLQCEEIDATRLLAGVSRVDLPLLENIIPQLWQVRNLLQRVRSIDFEFNPLDVEAIHDEWRIVDLLEQIKPRLCPRLEFQVFEAESVGFRAFACVLEFYNGLEAEIIEHETVASLFSHIHTCDDFRSFVGEFEDAIATLAKLAPAFQESQPLRKVEGQWFFVLSLLAGNLSDFATYCVLCSGDKSPFHEMEFFAPIYELNELLGKIRAASCKASISA